MKLIILAILVVGVSASADDCAGLKRLSYTDAASLHNEKRKLHENTPDLVEDPQLARAAEECACYMVKNPDAAPHSCKNLGSNGENIYTSYGGGEELQLAIDSWYEELEWPREDSENGPGTRIIDFTPGWHVKLSRDPDQALVGHVIQMLWTSAHKVGCGGAHSEEWGESVFVCRYDVLRKNTAHDLLDNFHQLKPVESTLPDCDADTNPNCQALPCHLTSVQKLCGTTCGKKNGTCKEKA